MNGPLPTILVDTKWRDHRMTVALYHESCVQRIAKFYKMAHPEQRYVPYTEWINDSATCDFCHRSLVWSLAGHMRLKDA